MRRIVDQSSIGQSLVNRRDGSLGPCRLVVLAWCLTLTVWASAASADDLELTPPSNMPGTVKPVKPAPGPSIAPAAPSRVGGGGRAVLALPGLTRPALRPSNPSPPPLQSTPSISAIPDELTLDAPTEMRGAPSINRPNGSPLPARSPRPTNLDSTVSDEPLPINDPPTRTSPLTKKPLAPRTDSQPQPDPAPMRRARLFGPRPTAPTPSGPLTSTTRAPAAGRAMVDDLKEDPAVESALKRRIERQAREAVGDRVRSVEVKLVGKNAVIQAHGVKFLQKRGVRKSLEAIPALSGLKSTIEVND